MSKGLKALESIKDSFKFNVHKLVYNANKNDFKIIEKELIDGEESKKMLVVFKNALTIEHHEIAELDHSQDANDYFVRELFTIEQNQIDIAMRKALREWVLKNAFPKEIKALEIIRNKPQHELAQIQWKKVNTYEEYEKIVYRWDSDYWDMIYTKEEFDLLKEVLL